MKNASIVAIEQCDRSKKNIVLIDSTVENWQVLAEGVILEAEIVILNREEDGIAQIDRNLRLHTNIDSVHIVSHGSPGCLYLGNGTFNLDNLAQYANRIKSWSSLLTATHLSLYGCNVAAGEPGRKFLQQLQSLTCASISASARPTGHHTKGGDWELEVGQQNAIAFSQTVTESYAGILATFTVNTIADENDGINTGKVSLRDAIAAANSSAGSDTIEFDAGLNGTIKLANGVLQIADDVTINGTGSDRITVDGDGKSRVFGIDDGNESEQIEVAIDGLTVTGGNTHYSPSGDNFYEGSNVLNRENLTITSSVISGDLDSSARGSIRNIGKLSINNSTVSKGSYGGIVSTGTLAVKGSRISDNRDLGILGEGTVLVTESTISGNLGVGIDNFGNFTLTNSTISGNYNGGIYNDGENLIVANSTIAKNGSGLINFGSSQGEQIVKVSNSLIAGNIKSDVNYRTNSTGIAISSQGGNVIGIGNAIVDFDSKGDIVGISDPDIEDFANNGGLTQTHALKPDSPAINAGNNNLIPDGITTDQRGETRIQDGKVDAGAFESNFVFPSTPIVTLISLGSIVFEGEPQVVCRLSRSGNTANPLNVNLSAVADAGLTSGDFNLGGTTGSLPDFTATIPAGKSFVDLTLTAIDDGKVEGDENLTFSLKPNDIYRSDRVSNNATVAILDVGNLVVTNTNDSGQGSLRQAILNANRIAGANTIEFDASLAGQTINLTSGGLLITDDLIVTGLGADKLTVRGGFGVSDYDLGNFKDLLEVKIEGLTITEGGIGNTENLTVKNSVITNGSGISHASLGFYRNKLTVIDSTISGNTGNGISCDNSDITVSGSTIADNDEPGIQDRKNSEYYSSNINVNNSNIRNNNGGGIFGGGSVTVTNSTILENKPKNDVGNGGGIFAENVVVNNSTISGNTTSGNGGGIGVIGKNASLTVNKSKIYNNTASGNGGGISCISNYGGMTVTNSKIYSNTASRSGGGIDSFTQLESTIVTDSSIDGNRASQGGGINAYSQENITITNNTISNNEATKIGGGISASSRKNVTVANSTISGNTADEKGGGIYSYVYYNAPVNVANSTVTNNAAENGGGIFNTGKYSSNFNVKNAIVAGNIDTSGNDNPDVSGTFSSNGFNLIGNTSGSTGFENDLAEPDIDKILDRNLADNGGSTLTHALVPGSRAINAGNNSDIPDGITNDQRGEGFSRIVGGKVDIGAYELQTTGNAIDGTDGDDNLDGTAEDDIINGLAGNDFIDGKAGNDTIDGGTGNLDRIFGSDGDDTIIDRDGVNGAHGGLGNDTIEVTFAASWDNDNKPGSSPRSDGKISGGYGNDDITVTMNKNNFFINLKGDEPKGNNSQDGNDTITLLGSYGNSVVDLGGGNDTFNGGGGKDNVSSGNGNDLIIGLGGSDRIAGGNDNDILIGGAGKDELIGGADSDIFVLASGEGTDYLTDFTDNSDFIGLAGGLSFADLTIASNGKNAQLSITSTGELLVILNGINPNALSAVDFTAV